MVSLSKRSALSRLAVIFAPTISWWWKDTHAARLELARGGLADVVHQRREPQHQVGGGDGAVGVRLQVDRLLDHRERVLVDVLVVVVLVDLELQGGQLGQHVRREP